MNTGAGRNAVLYRRNQDVVCRTIAGETILVPIKGKLADLQRIFALNAAGEYIWGRLNGATPLEEIRDGIRERFAVDRERAEADLRDFIAALRDEGLITE